MVRLIKFLKAWFNYFLFKYFKKEIIIENTFLGKRFFACKNNIEYYRANNYGDEEEALGAFLFLLEPNDVIWDIGTSIGLFSIYSAPHVKQVFSFEPDPEIFQRFNKNIGLNYLQNKITSYQLGISNKEGIVTLSSDGLDGSSPSISDLGRHSNKTTINVNSIDNLIEAGLDRPSILKIDIEGAEILALQGAKKLLESANSPRLIFMEVHPEFLPFFNSNAQEVIKNITDHGYLIISQRERDKQIHLIAVKY